MRFRVLATDFDGTLARDGKVDADTVEALRGARAAGVRLVLVTGRELASLFNTFDGSDVFDRIVAENGAVCYAPDTHVIRGLSVPPPPELLETLQQANVPISVGHSIVATVLPHDAAVREAIRQLGLAWHVILNKDAVMALPASVNKATGLEYALSEIEMTTHDTVGIGDAQNDEAFMRICGLSVAVANALPELKALANITTAAARGEGVRELLARWSQL